MTSHELSLLDEISGICNGCNRRSTEKAAALNLAGTHQGICRSVFRNSR
jgi:hypothetical protein